MGAASVEYLVHSPMIRQSHFQRVILMSGSMFSSWSRVDNPAENAVKLARELGCPLPADLHTHHTNILDCLRSPAQHIFVPTFIYTVDRKWDTNSRIFTFC